MRNRKMRKGADIRRRAECGFGENCFKHRNSVSFFGPHRAPGRELSEIISACYFPLYPSELTEFCAEFTEFAKEHQWVLSSKTVLSKHDSARSQDICGSLSCLVATSRHTLWGCSYPSHFASSLYRNMQIVCLVAWPEFCSKPGQTELLLFRKNHGVTSREGFDHLLAAPCSSGVAKACYAGVHTICLKTANPRLLCDCVGRKPSIQFFSLVARLPLWRTIDWQSHSQVARLRGLTPQLEAAARGMMILCQDQVTQIRVSTGAQAVGKNFRRTLVRLFPQKRDKMMLQSLSKQFHQLPVPK